MFHHNDSQLLEDVNRLLSFVDIRSRVAYYQAETIINERVKI